MSSVPISRTRQYRVIGSGRSRVLVPPQPVPRKITIHVVGPDTAWISGAGELKLRERPELPDCAEMPADVRIPFRVVAGEGRWVITQGPLVPVLVTIEYLWDQDPDVGIDDARLVDAKQDETAYDIVADRNFDGLLCNDPWRLMELQAAREARVNEARQAAENGSA